MSFIFNSKIKTKTKKVKDETCSTSISNNLGTYLQKTVILEYSLKLLFKLKNEERQRKEKRNKQILNIWIKVYFQ